MAQQNSRVILLCALLVLAVLAYRQTLFTSVSFMNGKTVYAEIADSKASREHGLMYRTYLRNDEGMLFVYPEEAVRGFWMKNTLIDLDIIYLDKDKTIVELYTMKPCLQEECEIYSSTEKAMYVLEVNAGFIEAHDLKKGQVVELNL